MFPRTPLGGLGARMAEFAVCPETAGRRLDGEPSTGSEPLTRFPPARPFFVRMAR